MASLGKRKERDDDDQHGSTLFVSNLPYTATSVDLETLFSDIAPVRTAFVVTEQGSGVSKGVGYVSFALKEDAEMCFKQVSEEGLEIVGRKIRIQWADKKKRKEETSSTPKPRPREPTIRTPHDPLAIRTILISGLPAPLDSHTLWKKIRKCPGAESLTYPAKNACPSASNNNNSAEENDDPSQAHVLFKTPSQASDAVSKLHAHVYKGSLLSVTLKKRLEGLAKAVAPKRGSTSASASASATSANAASATASSKATDGIPNSNNANANANAKATPTSIAPNRSSRLIVRNLPFTATEQDLRALFLPYGPVHSITMPKPEGVPAKDVESKSPSKVVESKSQSQSEGQDTQDDNDDDDGDEDNEHKKEPQPPTQTNRGFAFIWMLSKKDAQNALEGCNGKTIRAGLARELVEAKQKRKKQLRMERRAKGVDMGNEGAGGEDEKEDDNEEENDEGTHKHTATERVIAVDWALSKEKWKEEKAKIEEAVEAEDGDSEGSEDEEEDGDGGSDSDVEMESGSEDEDEALGVHGDSSSSSGSSHSSLSLPSDSSDSSHSDSDSQEPTKPALPPPSAGTTLFIRNVPYTASSSDLQALFRAFGPLRYARVTMDAETGRSRGTGFACFWNREDADKVLEVAEGVRGECGLGSAMPKKNPFSLPSILTPDPSSSLARSLVLHGRTLDCVRAVTRDVATKLREEGERMREKQDKRNMYLLREGLIHPSSNAASLLTPADVERRTASYTQRRALLKSNPALFISRTRLSIRQLPLYVSERMLKRLCVHAKREFEREVGRGEREGLAEEEEASERGENGEKGLEEILRRGLEKEEGRAGGDDASGDHKHEGKKPHTKNPKGRDTGVKQTKIIRQPERVDPLTGKGRSKGYGFVEMTTHADALRVLRWANNNPGLGALWREWFREELGDCLKRAKAGVKADAKAKARADGDGEKGDEGKRKGKKGDEAKDKATTDEARMKRIKDELDAGVPSTKGEKGTLIVEFSIENVQVVQRRAQAAAAGARRARGEVGGEVDEEPERKGKGRDSRAPNNKRSKRDRDEDRSEGAGSQPSNKRRRVEKEKGKEKKPDSAAPNTSAAGKADKAKKPSGSENAKKSSGTGTEKPKKAFNPVGAVIGRKRREKAGRRAKA